MVLTQIIGRKKRNAVTTGNEKEPGTKGNLLCMPVVTGVN